MCPFSGFKENKYGDKNKQTKKTQKLNLKWNLQNQIHHTYKLPI